MSRTRGKNAAFGAFTRTAPATASSPGVGEGRPCLTIRPRSRLASSLVVNRRYRLSSLRRYLRFTTSELADLERGRIVKHGLPSPTPGELAVAGAVRVNAPKAAFFPRVRDIPRFKSGPDGL